MRLYFIALSFPAQMRQQVWGRSHDVCGPVAWHRVGDADHSACVRRRWWRGVPQPPQQGGQDEEAAVAQAESRRGRPHGHGARRVADGLPGAGHWGTVWGEELRAWHPFCCSLQFPLSILKFRGNGMFSPIKVGHPNTILSTVNTQIISKLLVQQSVRETKHTHTERVSWNNEILTFLRNSTESEIYITLLLWYDLKHCLGIWLM